MPTMMGKVLSYLQAQEEKEPGKEFTSSSLEKALKDMARSSISPTLSQFCAHKLVKFVRKESKTHVYQLTSKGLNKANALDLTLEPIPLTDIKRGPRGKGGNGTAPRSRSKRGALITVQYGAKGSASYTKHEAREIYEQLQDIFEA